MTLRTAAHDIIALHIRMVRNFVTSTSPAEMTRFTELHKGLLKAAVNARHGTADLGRSRQSGLRLIHRFYSTGIREHTRVLVFRAQYSEIEFADRTVRLV